MNEGTPSPGPEVGDDELLEYCPRCSYSLRGLPVEHRCPECGLDFDRRWQVFGGRTMLNRVKRTLSPVYMVLIIVITNALVMLTVTLLVSRAPMSFTLTMIGVVLAAGLVAWIAIGRLKCFAALGPHGLTVYRGRDRIELHRWDELGRAQYDLLWKRVKVTRSGGDVYLEVNRFFGANTDEIDRCVQAINRYPRSERPA